MKFLRKFKMTLLVALFGIGLSGSLTACVFEDGGRGGHEGHWR
jgi:hypothetical protein